MPIFDIKDFRQYSPVYVETGSCLGESINRALKAGFKRLKSCEYHEPFYRHCLDRFKGKPVELFLGKSVDNLDKMLADVYEPAVIFLDAHPAGPGTGGHEELLQGISEFHQNNILKAELQIITEHRNDHIIIIDDTYPGPDADQLKAILEGYIFEFMDEQLPNSPIVHDKVLVARPF